MKIMELERIEIKESIQEETIKCYCHLYFEKNFSYCGIPRAEQTIHWGWDNNSIMICPSCGLNTCPRCKRLNTGYKRFHR